MRKVFLLAMLLVSTFAMAQLNLQLHYDLGRHVNPNSVENRQFVTTTVEYFGADKLGSTFFFIDMDYYQKDGGETKKGTIGAYWEIGRDFTFANVKNSNVSFTGHVEYDGGLNCFGPFQQALLVGPALQWHNNNFKKTFTFQAMYKQMLKGNGINAHASFQTTAVWGIKFANDLCTFSGFADLWYATTPKGEKGLIFLSEPQFWFNLVNRHQSNRVFSVGTEIELSNNFVYPTNGASRTFYVNPTIAVKYTF